MGAVYDLATHVENLQRWLQIAFVNGWRVRLVLMLAHFCSSWQFFFSFVKTFLKINILSQDIEFSSLIKVILKKAKKTLCFFASSSVKNNSQANSISKQSLLAVSIKIFFFWFERDNSFFRWWATLVGNFLSAKFDIVFFCQYWL